MAVSFRAAVHSTRPDGFARNRSLADGGNRLKRFIAQSAVSYKILSREIILEKMVEILSRESFSEMFVGQDVNNHLQVLIGQVLSW